MLQTLQLKLRLLYIGIIVEPQLILLRFKPEGNGTFVNFLIVIKSSYTETRLKSVNNNLGKDQRNSGLNLVASFMQGKSIGHFKRHN